MNKIEEASTDFGNKYIKLSNDYPLINPHRRKQLITNDVYALEEALKKVHNGLLMKLASG